MKEIEYNRNAVYEYAKKWSFGRNPKYYNYDLIGGDCTNFVSQCIYAGSNIMNYKKEYGWYYINGNNKSPSWTGVEFLYNFLVQNKSVGPVGKEIKKDFLKELRIGDVIQLSFDGNIFTHSLIIVGLESKYNLNLNLNLNWIKVASHTFDCFNKSVNEYSYKKIRFIHILNVRKW